MGDMYQANRELSQLIETYTNTLLKIAFTYVKSIHDAQDIVQDVFIKYIKASPSFQNLEHEKAWFIRVTIHTSLDLIKSGWFCNRYLIPDDLSYMPKEESEVLQAVLSLHDKYKLPIHLFYYEGYSIEEISTILSEKPATIGTRLARGRKQLKKILGGIDFE